LRNGKTPPRGAKNSKKCGVCVTITPKTNCPSHCHDGGSRWQSVTNRGNQSKNTTRFSVSPFLSFPSGRARASVTRKTPFLGGNAQKRDLLILQGKTHRVFVTIASHWQQWQQVAIGVAMVAILVPTRKNPSIYFMHCQSPFLCGRS